MSRIVDLTELSDAALTASMRVSFVLWIGRVPEMVLESMAPQSRLARLELARRAELEA